MKESIEKHSFKITIGVALSFLLIFFAITNQFSRWQTTMEAEHVAMTTRQDHLSNGQASIRAIIGGMETRQDSVEIVQANIIARLTNIEALLIEIRQDMRDLKR